MYFPYKKKNADKSKEQIEITLNLISWGKLLLTIWCLPYLTLCIHTHVNTVLKNILLKFDIYTEKYTYQ